jgi:hypothetical protein
MHALHTDGRDKQVVDSINGRWNSMNARHFKDLLSQEEARQASLLAYSPINIETVCRAWCEEIATALDLNGEDIGGRH